MTFDSATVRPDLDDLRADATRKQRAAADPAVSAWVSANAGTGKTHVLVQRVLLLLLAGTPASGILAITFTKAAAAEMSNRLIRHLGRWAALPDDELTAALTALLERAPSPHELAHARCLFAEVLDAPGGLKIMTIHAFCDRVLRRFPLEAGVPPAFTILTDEDKRTLMREATDAVLGAAATDKDSALGQALLVAVQHAGEDRFATLLGAVLGKWEEIAREVLRKVDPDDAFGEVGTALRRALGVGREDTPEAILAAQADVLPDAVIAEAVKVLRTSEQVTNTRLANALAGAHGARGGVRIEAFSIAFLTEGKARARLVTNSIRNPHPGLAAELDAARDRFAQLEIQRRAVEVATATVALLRLADAVLQRYEEAKFRASALDFDALIAKTAALLSRSDASAWVLYRLDADITHILVDEAQDTSPAQWALIEALTAEFFSGAGAEETQRTLFAVGDEKQSIYSFQGAEPKRFAEAGTSFSVRAQHAGEAWVKTPLTLSFRSTSAVLDAVDLVFADPEQTPGVPAGQAGRIEHNANRDGEAGLVEIWPIVKAEKREAGPAFEPFSDEAGAQPPAVQVANRIAGQIRQWLDAGEVLTSQNRPITAGDILILVRKRTPFAAPMVKALKDHGIPVAGADRLRLTTQLAVMDLMVLGDVMLLPHDDLALATLLKSPFFDFNDDELFAIGYGRDGSLWETLAACAQDDKRAAEAMARLERWRELALRQKPYEFYMGRLEAEGWRTTLLARLGAEAADAIAEFLNLAIAYEAGRAPSLQGFLHWLRISGPEIKRDMDLGRDEVRVMTAHGAKGLEANVVFLPDTCSARGGNKSGVIMLDAELDGGREIRLPAWCLPGAALIPQIAEAQEAIRDAESAEYQRLLYVAMTRARDRLYVAGFEGLKARDRGCWYDLIGAGLDTQLVEIEDGEGGKVRRMTCPQILPVKEATGAVVAAESLALPTWIREAAPAEQTVDRVAPSRIGANQPGGSPVAGQSDGVVASPDEALLRGRLVHRLLELLPEVPANDRQAAAARFLAAEGAALSADTRAALQNRVIDILNMPPFATVFGPGSRAEVALAAELPRADGAPILISGQVDRLIIGEGEIVAVDFKTGAFVPRRPEWTSPAYLKQLAAYRFVLSQLFPGKPVRTALLWTAVPALMEIPGTILDTVDMTLFTT